MSAGFLQFVESLPAVTGLLLLAYAVVRLPLTAARKHQILVSVFALVVMLPLMHRMAPKWRVLPRWEVEELQVRDPSLGGAAVEEARESSSGNGLPPSTFSWGTALMTLWLGGVALRSMQMLWGWLMLLRVSRGAAEIRERRFRTIWQRVRKRLDVPWGVSIRQTNAVRLPLVWGWWRPMVLLPSEFRQWSNEELESVLMHEVAHIVRHDVLANFLRQAALVLYWFHPLMIGLARRQGLVREMACDDHVILAGQDSRSYAEHLTNLVAGIDVRRDVELASGLGSMSPLRHRLMGILDGGRSRRIVTSGDVVYSGTPLLAAGLMLASLGFKAAAEYQVDRVNSEASRETSEEIVFSVWDDLVVPLVDAPLAMVRPPEGDLVGIEEIDEEPSHDTRRTGFAESAFLLGWSTDGDSITARADAVWTAPPTLDRAEETEALPIPMNNMGLPWESLDPLPERNFRRGLSLPVISPSPRADDWVARILPVPIANVMPISAPGNMGLRFDSGLDATIGLVASDRDFGSPVAVGDYAVGARTISGWVSDGLGPGVKIDFGNGVAAVPDGSFTSIGPAIGFDLTPKVLPTLGEGAYGSAGVVVHHPESGLLPFERIDAEPVMAPGEPAKDATVEQVGEGIAALDFVFASVAILAQSVDSAFELALSDGEEQTSVSFGAAWAPGTAVEAAVSPAVLFPEPMVIHDGEGGRHLGMKCLVARDVPTEFLVAQRSEDLRGWDDVPREDLLWWRSAFDGERDEVVFSLRDSMESVASQFLRLRVLSWTTFGEGLVVGQGALPGLGH